MLCHFLCVYLGNDLVEFQKSICLHSMVLLKPALYKVGSTKPPRMSKPGLDPKPNYCQCTCWYTKEEKLQRVFNAAARVVSKRSKYDQGLTQFRFQTLHWLDVADRIRFRLCLQVHKSQHSMAPGYLADLCKPVSNINIYRDLRSAGRGQLDIP